MLFTFYVTRKNSLEKRRYSAITKFRKRFLPINIVRHLKLMIFFVCLHVEDRKWEVLKIINNKLTWVIE